jgi:hypothetical protein
MPELSTSERLKQAQARVKALAASRDQIIGDIRVANQKLKQSYENLRELGVEAPEDLTLKQLSALAKKFSATGKPFYSSIKNWRVNNVCTHHRCNFDQE